MLLKREENKNDLSKMLLSDKSRFYNGAANRYNRQYYEKSEATLGAKVSC